MSDDETPLALNCGIIIAKITSTSVDATQRAGPDA